MTDTKEQQAVPEMVERVAQALYLAESKAQPVEFYYGLARAAIAAMREPTGGQQAAWIRTLSWMSDTPLGNQQREAWAKENVRRWQIMIDAAIGDITSETAPAPPPALAPVLRAPVATGSGTDASGQEIGPARDAGEGGTR